jgi:ABC-type phosphate/phosphonate transport system permease subunit
MSPAHLSSQAPDWRATWITFIVAALFAWSLVAIEFSPGRMLQVPAQVAEQLGFFYPIDMAYGWESVLPAIVESIQIAWIGTSLPPSCRCRWPCWARARCFRGFRASSN